MQTSQPWSQWSARTVAAQASHWKVNAIHRETWLGHTPSLVKIFLFWLYSKLCRRSTTPPRAWRWSTRRAVKWTAAIPRVCNQLWSWPGRPTLLCWWVKRYLFSWVVSSFHFHCWCQHCLRFRLNLTFVYFKDSEPKSSSINLIYLLCSLHLIAIYLLKGKYNCKKLLSHESPIHKMHTRSTLADPGFQWGGGAKWKTGIHGRSREARRPCIARLKTSWGCGGRCKPPSGVWGSAPENFENQTFFLSQNGHFWLLLSMNESCRGETLPSKLPPSCGRRCPDFESQTQACLDV